VDKDIEICLNRSFHIGLKFAFGIAPRPRDSKLVILVTQETPEFGIAPRPRDSKLPAKIVEVADQFGIAPRPRDSKL
jgi:hypothetical protein